MKAIRLMLSDLASKKMWVSIACALLVGVIITGFFSGVALILERTLGLTPGQTLLAAFAMIGALCWIGSALTRAYGDGR